MNRKLSIFTLVALLGFGLSFSSCDGNAEKDNKTPQTNGQPATGDDSGNTAKSANSGEMDKAQKSKVLDAYLTVKDALVGTDGSVAAEAAKGLVAAVGTGEDELSKGIRFDAEHIRDTKEVDHQREHFNSLSASVFELVKGAGLGKKLYKQYCPMAFEGKGAFWVSAESEIMNPYFGDMMLHCGKIQEEI
jgi:hypothetical protein